jgi:hypothetical protein
LVDILKAWKIFLLLVMSGLIVLIVILIVAIAMAATTDISERRYAVLTVI